MDGDFDSLVMTAANPSNHKRISFVHPGVRDVRGFVSS